MKSCLSFFRIKVAAGLQYRAAAWAGVSTQFFWGFMYLMLFRAFYAYNPAAFPMPLAAMSSYIWLQQALLALVSIWNFDMEAFASIESGGVVYELCRPVDLYGMWFSRALAGRCAAVLLRMGPILLVASLLPAPYGMGLPASWPDFGLFLLSLAMGVGVLVAFGMLISLSVFHMLSSQGIRLIAVAIVEFLAGAVVPLPFFPQWMQRALLLLPFASIQSTPFLVYTGYYQGTAIGWVLLIQAFWLVALVALGRRGFARMSGRVVLQGG